MGPSCGPGVTRSTTVRSLDGFTWVTTSVSPRASGGLSPAQIHRARDGGAPSAPWTTTCCGSTSTTRSRSCCVYGLSAMGVLPLRGPWAMAAAAQDPGATLLSRQGSQLRSRPPGWIGHWSVPGLRPGQFGNLRLDCGQQMLQAEFLHGVRRVLRNEAQHQEVLLRQTQVKELLHVLPRGLPGVVCGRGDGRLLGRLDRRLRALDEPVEAPRPVAKGATLHQKPPCTTT